jgi:hypothetical protein
MATVQSRRVMITDDNVGPILAIVTWFLMTMMILAVIILSTIQIVIRHSFSKEDYWIGGAMVGIFITGELVRKKCSRLLI